MMKTRLAWRNLTHTKARTLVSTAGMAFVIQLIFVQLGLYTGVVNTATQVYNQLYFDIMLTSPHYMFITSARTFPRQRLYQALTVDGVASAKPFYVALTSWQNLHTRLRYGIMLMAFHPSDHVFRLPELTEQSDRLRYPDMVLIDRETRPALGPRSIGMVTEVNQRQITIAGEYTLGIGFGALGVIITSDQNFSRIMQGYDLEQVNFGLITVSPGVAPDGVVHRLRRLLPPDVQVLTRDELGAIEQRYWVEVAAIGVTFGSGAIVAFLVGMVIVYQVLANHITNHFAEYATLKALGYSDTSIARVVLQQALTLALLGFVPALAMALGIYELIRQHVHLLISMTLERFVFVLVLVVVMCAVSGLIALRKVKKADPAELF